MNADHLAALRAAHEDGDNLTRFHEARTVLREHLVRTRDVPNGCDYLFEGPEELLRHALHVLVTAERKVGWTLHIDYARVENFFLLRIVSRDDCSEACDSYFTDLS